MLIESRSVATLATWEQLAVLISLGMSCAGSAHTGICCIHLTLTPWACCLTKHLSFVPCKVQFDAVDSNQQKKMCIAPHSLWFCIRLHKIVGSSGIVAFPQEYISCILCLCLDMLQRPSPPLPSPPLRLVIFAGSSDVISSAISAIAAASDAAEAASASAEANGKGTQEASIFTSQAAGYTVVALIDAFLNKKPLALAAAAAAGALR